MPIAFQASLVGSPAFSNASCWGARVSCMNFLTDSLNISCSGVKMERVPTSSILLLCTLDGRKTCSDPSSEYFGCCRTVVEVDKALVAREKEGRKEEVKELSMLVMRSKMKVVKVKGAKIRGWESAVT